MFAAYTVMTLIVGFFMGVIALASAFVYMDGRDQKRRAAAKAEQRRTNPTQFQKDVDRARDRLNMQAAEQLVQDTLGAEVISRESH